MDQILIGGAPLLCSFVMGLTGFGFGLLVAPLLSSFPDLLPLGVSLVISLRFQRGDSWLMCSSTLLLIFVLSHFLPFQDFGCLPYQPPSKFLCHHGGCSRAAEGVQDYPSGQELLIGISPSLSG